MEVCKACDGRGIIQREVFTYHPPAWEEEQCEPCYGTGMAFLTEEEYENYITLWRILNE
jgi:DnaJ-class molecular chaperone